MGLNTRNVTLPSRGKVNGIGESVTIREMTLKADQELLSNRSPSEKIINVVQQCLVSPADLRVEDLPLVDILFLMYELRALSLDENYNYTMKCANCDFKFTKTLSVPSDFETQYAPDDFSEPFELKLPSGKVLGIRVLRGKDMLEIERKTSKMLQQSRGTSDISSDSLALPMLYAKRIKTIDGKEASFYEAQAFAESMTYKDSNAFKDFLEEDNFGVNTTFFASCPSCQSEEEYNLKLTPDFFRPKRNKQGATK